MSAQNLGLDELMIVNPGQPPLRADERYFLGEDGGLYRSSGLGPEGLGETGPIPSRFFLGDDGTLYQVMPRPR